VWRVKSEVYNAIAALNRSFDVVLESLTILQQEGVVSPDYLQRKSEITEKMRSDINAFLKNKLESREKEDRHHFGKMRMATEAQLTELKPI